MKNVLQVLSQLGASADLQSPESVAEFVNQSELSTEMQAALIEQDVTLLSHNLDVRSNIVCAIMAPEDDEPEETPEKEDDNKEESSLLVAI